MTDYLPRDAVNAAGELALAIRDYDKDAITAILADYDPAVLAVTLAAMVDVDRTPAELLAWNDDIEATVEQYERPRKLSPCGTHAAFTRHRANGTEPCGKCWEGERAYQRARSRRRSRRAVEVLDTSGAA